MMQRSLLIFQNSVKSKETAKGFTWYLDKFKEFYKLKDYDSMVTIPQGKLQIMIEDYIMDLKSRINPNSIPTHFYPLQSFFEANDLELRWRKIKKLFPAQIKASGRSAYTNSDIQLLLSHTTNLRNKALIHFLASTGCRIGALPDLKIKNITDMPNDCKAVLIYEDSTDEYFTFLTSEAWNVLDRYLKQRKDDREYITEDSPLFRIKYRLGIEKPKSMTIKAIQSVMLRCLRNAGLRTSDKKKNGRFEKQTDHGFRKRFVTILKSNTNIPIAYAERLAGHKVYIDDRGNKIQLDESYMRPELKKLFEVFKMAIPELTIDDNERLRAENKQARYKVDKIQSLEKKIERLADELADVQDQYVKDTTPYGQDPETGEWKHANFYSKEENERNARK